MEDEVAAGPHGVAVEMMIRRAMRDDNILAKIVDGRMRLRVTNAELERPIAVE